MSALHDAARGILESGAAAVVIGHGEGTATGARPLFVRDPAKAGELVFDERCVHNLAVYLLKPEVKALGRAALVGQPPTLRSVLQLAAEQQLKEGDVILLLPEPDGGVRQVESFADIERAVSEADAQLSPEERACLDEVAALPREERWRFWQQEFTRCLKCYACRAACPLCYCTQCIVDVNQPQWIPVPPHPLGNMDWHVVRAMHLAGRCIGCGACARACPVDIPLNLLNQVIEEEIAGQFDARAGLSASASYALSTFTTGDKDTFIR
ncbi:MAG: 4Fe-4S dicluster domain-containing protein [Candidatus Eisenbacteria bacterium]|jgi:ferredoxin|nr:4Fe-4S dicluster domain-containing protein [Candidatus Eisenbacteria bacterium]